MRILRSKRWATVLSAALALTMFLAACQTGETDTTTDDSTVSTTAPATETPDDSGDTGTPEDSSGSTGDKHERYDDETPFVATYPVDFTLISPLGDVSAATKQVFRNLHEGLYQYNTDGSLTDGVAESIEVTHEEPYIVAAITLRDDVSFHNGDPLNAEAVEYSLNRLAGLVEGITSDDVTGAGYWPNLLNPQPAEDSDEEPATGRIEIADEHTLTVYMNDQYGVLTTMHSLADAWLVPAGYAEDEQKSHPVGLGPYEFVEYQEGNMVRMTRFEDYYGDKPQIKNVEFHKYADAATLPIAFQSGEIDILALTRETYATYSEQDLYINEGLSNDVRAMNDTLTNGRGTPLYTHMTPFLSTYYNDELEEVYTHDVEQAQEHLANAGYADGFDVTLKIVAENAIGQDMAVLIQEDRAEVGVTVTIDAIPWATYYEEVYRGHNFDLAILNVVGYPDPSRVLSRYMSEASGNLAGFQSETIDNLLNEARQSEDQDGLAVANYREVQQILTENSVAVYLIDPGVQTVLSEDYGSYAHYPFAFTDLAKVEYR